MDADGITAFIEARLAEARHTAEGLSSACRDPGREPDFFACGGPAAEEYWHCFDPDHMLRQLAAIRRILTRHHDDGRGRCTGCKMVTADMCPEKRDLAAIWEAHPEYNGEMVVQVRRPRPSQEGITP